MTNHFGRPGRRADLARLLHESLVDCGMTPLEGATRLMIDRRVREISEALRISETAALKEVREIDVVRLAERTAAEWHAAKAAQDAAGSFEVAVPGESAAQLLMGLSMAVGQLVREVLGDLPASAGDPLDAMCELAGALKDALAEDGVSVEVTLETLSKARAGLLAAAAGVADGTVPVVLPDDARPRFAAKLYADAELALRLQP